MKKLIIVLALAISLIGCTGGEQPGGENTPAPVNTMDATPAPGGETTSVEGVDATPAEGADATPAEDADATSPDGAEATPADGAATEATPTAGEG